MFKTFTQQQQNTPFNPYGEGDDTDDIKAYFYNLNNMIRMFKQMTILSNFTKYEY